MNLNCKFSSRRAISSTASCISKVSSKRLTDWLTDNNEFLVLIIFIFDELNCIFCHIACISSPAVIEETLNLYALVGKAAEYHKPIITTNVTCSFIVPLVDFSECSLQFIIDGVCLFHIILTIEFIRSVWTYLSLNYEMIRWTRTFIASTVVAAHSIITSIAIFTSSFPFVRCNDRAIFPCWHHHWVWNIVCMVSIAQLVCSLPKQIGSVWLLVGWCL